MGFGVGFGVVRRKGTVGAFLREVLMSFCMGGWPTLDVGPGAGLRCSTALARAAFVCGAGTPLVADALRFCPGAPGCLSTADVGGGMNFVGGSLTTGNFPEVLGTFFFI